MNSHPDVRLALKMQGVGVLVMEWHRIRHIVNNEKEQNGGNI